MTTTYQPAIPIWCAGCGHFGVQAAMNGAIRTLEIPPHETMILAGIGCSGTVQNNLGTYGYHALHGRVLPTAAGVHLAGHLVHSFRRNASFTYVVMNNGVYGLTKGQNSPTFQSNGSAALEFDAISLGLSIPSTTFLARGFARWTDQLDRLMLAAVEHARAGRGFAFIEVLSPCVTYNDTYPVWEASLHDLDADGDHDPADRAAAFAKLTALAETGRMVVGQIYLADDAGPADPLPRPAAEDTSPTTNAQAYAELLGRYRV